MTIKEKTLISHFIGKENKEIYKQLFCRHQYKSGNAKIHRDPVTGKFTVVEKCIKCGKEDRFSF